MSRELDEKIARVVMGLDQVCMGHAYICNDDEPKSLIYFGGPPPRLLGKIGWYEVPAYSTDIVAAWAVVYRMRGLGWDWILHHDREDKLATAEFQHRDGRIGFAQHESVSEAICQAALAALETK